MVALVAIRGRVFFFHTATTPSTATSHRHPLNLGLSASVVWCPLEVVQRCSLHYEPRLYHCNPYSLNLYLTTASLLCAVRSLLRGRRLIPLATASTYYSRACILPTTDLQEVAVSEGTPPSVQVLNMPKSLGRLWRPRRATSLGLGTR